MESIKFFNYSFEDRVCLISSDPQNDVNPDTGKAGIRFHNKFTAFFLKILGKIEEYTTSTGEIIYLNKNSYQKWRERHQVEGSFDSLPTPEQVIEKKRQLKEEKLKNELNALQLQKEGIDPYFNKKIKDINQKIVKINNSYRWFELFPDPEKTKIINNHQKKIKNLKVQKQEELSRLDAKILKLQKLLDQYTLKSPEVYKEELLNDVENHADLKLRTLFEAMLEKSDNDIIQYWSFNPENGSFKIKFKRTVKLWVHPKLDTGEFDPKTPKGVILLLGNNPEHEITGRLDSEKHKMVFHKGYESFCEYILNLLIKTYTGVADVKVNSLKVTKKGKIEMITNGTDRNLGLGKELPEQRNLETLIGVWNGGKDPGDDHENYLTNEKYINS